MKVSKIGVNAQYISHITIHNKVEDLHLILKWLEENQHAFSIDDRSLFRMDLVLNESIPNIIDYGFKDNQSHLIDINLFKQDQGYLLEIIDGGVPFNPFETTYTPAQTLEEATINGRGIHLIRHFTDKQWYLRDDEHNIVMFLFEKTIL